MISRRRFVEYGFGGVLTLSGCASIEDANNAFYCQDSLAPYNPEMCRQLSIRGLVKRAFATLSMLFGVRRDAQIGQILERQVQIEAKLASQSELIMKYASEKRVFEQQERVLNVINNIQIDQRFCEATYSDLTSFSRKLDGWSGASFNEKLDMERIKPSITSVAKENIASFGEGANGYGKLADVDPSLLDDGIKINRDKLFERYLVTKDKLKSLEG